MAKKMFYDNLGISNRGQKDFVDFVEKIIWLYKLGVDTIGIEPTKEVCEIQIMELELKEKLVPDKILHLISKIPYKVLFVLKYNDEFCYCIRTITEEGTEKFNTTKWNEDIDFAFTGINLEYVYENIVKQILKQEDNTNLTFKEIVQLKSEKDELEKKIEILSKKIKAEKQPNRQQPLNQERNKMTERLGEINKLLNTNV